MYVRTYVYDQHIEIFDGLQEADCDSSDYNDFFDVRKERIFTRLFIARLYLFFKLLYIYLFIFIYSNQNLKVL